MESYGDEIETGPTSTDGSEDDSSAFARRLDELFQNIPGPGGRPYSAKTIAQRATERGYRIGESYLSQLRSGKAKSPSFRTVEGLAVAFGVDIRHFQEDSRARRTRAEIERLRADADPSIHQVAQRLSGLSKDSLDMVGDLVDVLRRRQGLVVSSPDEADLLHDAG